MKIKEVMKLIRESGMLFTYRNGSDNYIGDGAAVYTACGDYDIETLFTLTDTTKKQQEKLRVTPLADAEFMADIDGTETELIRMNFSINYGGSEFAVFESERGAVFMDKKYLKPLTDDLEMEFKLRTAGRREMIIVHYGLVTAAAIMPCQLLDIGFGERAERLSTLCKMARDNGLCCKRSDEE